MKYYYDCSIQALYMMKEFGIGLEIDNERDDDLEDFYSFKLLEHISLGEIRNGIEVWYILKDLNDDYRLKKIYVPPESEYIFKPVINDLGITSNGDYCVYSGESWLIDAGKRFIREEFVDIIFRDGKQFFMPKEKK